MNERGLDILIKPIPDDDRSGAMDPRLFAGTAPIVKGFRGFMLSLITPLFLRNRNPHRLAAFMRRYFNDVQSLPVTQGVSVRCDIVRTPQADLPIRIYRRESGLLPGVQGQEVPVFVYIHGGGFAAGNPDVVEEMVKQVVSFSGCIAVQPEYRLAPENPFPASLNDCWETVRWVYGNAAAFGGDPNRICVAGDSAGGNMAAVCAMRDRDEGGGMIKAQVLLYPVVNIARKEDEYYHFSLDQFTILREQKRSILFRIMAMRCSKGLLGCILGVRDETQPYLSPYLGELRNMPPCLILCGEFDCLRLEGEAYARKLKAAGVPVRIVRYLGMGHAFAEEIGSQPQAEDCMAEIARFITEMV
ncbi:MAG: alpha/beta hydrolase [Treponema sp.]|nr:alpha/beta hydrolase [Treponema sp.]